MAWLVLALVPLAFALAVPGTLAARALGHRLNALDGAGVAGQIKDAPRRVPNTGGVGVFWAIALPMLAGLLALRALDPASPPAWLPESISANLPLLAQRLADQTPLAILLLLCTLALHVTGLIDDRRPLRPLPKFGIMFLAAFLVAGAGSLGIAQDDTRLLTILDAPAGGAWLSIAITVLWIVAVTNAMNFMDNMDGLSAGVGAIAGSLFLAAALLNAQWFVGATLALLVGALAGFLVFNAPRLSGRGATIFMGDSGSLVVGFLLAVLTVRGTYLPPEAAGRDLSAGPWYALLMPVVVLAVPLYDLASVVIIRLSQGKSPFVGDLQHLSHRLTRLGLSRRAAVVVIWGFTAATGITGVMLASLEPWQAVLAGVQVLALLGVLAIFEFARARRAAQAAPASPASAAASPATPAPAAPAPEGRP